MGLLPVVGITSPALPQQVPFITRTNHANPKVQKLNQSTPQTTVSWTSRITLLTRNGQLAEAAKEFSDMRLAGVEPNHITFITLLSGCGDFASGGEDLGDLLHGYACKLGQVDNAVKMFDKMPERGLISWTSMINGFVKKGFHEEALVWFREMQISCSFDYYSYAVDHIFCFLEKKGSSKQRKSGSYLFKCVHAHQWHTDPVFFISAGQVSSWFCLSFCSYEHILILIIQMFVCTSKQLLHTKNLKTQTCFCCCSS